MLFYRDYLLMDIFNAVYFYLQSKAIGYFYKIAHQASGSRLYWGVTCQEYPDR
jgi:hypothetical protein